MREYEDYRDTAEQACLFVMRGNDNYVDIDEYKSIGFLTFHRLNKRTDWQDDTVFRKTLFTAVKNDIYRHLTSEEKQLSKIYYCKLTIRPDTTPSAEHNICFLDDLNHLSKEAQQVAATIFNSPSEIFETVCPGPRDSRKDIKAWCRKQGWQWKLIKSIFRELQEVV